jgi:hypothetical protein
MRRLDLSVTGRTDLGTHWRHPIDTVEYPLNAEELVPRVSKPGLHDAGGYRLASQPCAPAPSSSVVVLRRAVVRLKAIELVRQSAKSEFGGKQRAALSLTIAVKHLEPITIKGPPTYDAMLGTRFGLVSALFGTIHGIGDLGLERRLLLILFAESLKIGFAVRIERLPAALLPVLLNNAPRIREKRPVSSYSAAIIVRLGDIVGADRDRSAIANVHLMMELQQTFC